MVKKAYKIKKEGDYYTVPAGFVRGRSHRKVSTMDRNEARDVVKARKSLSLKRKYPEIRSTPPTKRQIELLERHVYEQQDILGNPMYISGGRNGLLKRMGIYTSEQVAKANENYYKKHGLETVVLKSKSGDFLLYVSHEGGV